MAKFRYSFDRMDDLINGIEGDLATAATATMQAVTTGLKAELRAQVQGAGLGTRLANTWQGKRFPETRKSIDPAAYIWSKAPGIIDAFDRGPTIVPVNGSKYLAIPTDNTPSQLGRGRGSKRKMTPLEVETAFNQDLKFRRISGGRLIAYITAIQAKNKRGWRQPTKGRLRQGRSQTQVAMFIMVPVAHMPKRLSVDAAVQHWVDKVGPLFEENLGNT